MTIRRIVVLIPIGHESDPAILATHPGLAELNCSGIVGHHVSFHHIFILAGDLMIVKALFAGFRDNPRDGGVGTHTNADGPRHERDNNEDSGENGVFHIVKLQFSVSTL